MLFVCKVSFERSTRGKKQESLCHLINLFYCWVEVFFSVHAYCTLYVVHSWKQHAILLAVSSEDARGISSHHTFREFHYFCTPIDYLELICHRTCILQGI